MQLNLNSEQYSGLRRGQMKIISARITPLPKCFGDLLPVVWVTVDGGHEERLFEYYPDEISFHPQEFLGLTISEARALRTKKDVDFLRS
jgi:hypothetical protein